MRNKGFFSALYQLLSSMRFAVSLLTLIAIASIIGTVLKQNELYASYQIEFGPFWFTVFEWLGFYDVYHASWFLLIFAFLVCSTSLCVYRHFPSILRNIRRFHLNVRLSSLTRVPHHAILSVTPSFPQQLESYLRDNGFRFRTQSVEEGSLWAAKKGHLQKLGYLFAHIGIIVICIGGLVDGNLILKFQELIGIKEPEVRQLLARDIPSQSRLSVDNPSFRANVSIPEGRAVDFAWVNSGRGVLLQELPFVLGLKAFHVDYYSTGQPKHFVSEVIVEDKKTGKKTSGTLSVNHPLIVDGVAIYQASFGDGGSHLAIQRWDLNTHHVIKAPIKFEATSRTLMPMSIDKEPYQIEWGELRVLNVENMGEAISTMAVAPGIGFKEKWDTVRNVKSTHHLRNIGPSIQFKLRNQMGQAREYINYLQPFFDDGAFYLFSGVKEMMGGATRFVRLPLDKDLSPKTFIALRAILLNPDNIKRLSMRMAHTAQIEAQTSSKSTLQKMTQLSLLTQMVLTRFQEGGFNALEDFMQTANIPEARRPQIAQTYTKIIQSAAIEALAMVREQDQKMEVFTTVEHRFVVDSLIAISQLFEYGAPVYLQPVSFQEIKASGFQITRAPGQGIVYLGCLLLIVGTFIMFYLREIRLWVYFYENKAIIAMGSNRKNRALDQIFAECQTSLQQYEKGAIQNEST